MLAGVPEATAGDVETANLCSDRGDYEDRDQHR